MNQKSNIFILIILLTLSFSNYMFGNQADLNTNKIKSVDTSVITVGFAGSAPFVKGETGISIQIWNKLMKKMDIKYKSVQFDGVPEALNALQSGKIDAVAGPTSITSERAERVKFSQPYFESGLSIVSPKDDNSLWNKIKPFFSKRFFYALMVFIFILAIVGTLLWLTERKKNTEEFPMEPAKGIANGMWCAIVTMSTTGYGDRSPRTLWGRIVASTWMIISLVFTTSMIAGIASVLTLSSMGSSTIENAEGLAGKKVGAVIDSPSDMFIKQYGGRVVGITNIEDGFEKLAKGVLDALVYDRPQLLYFLQQNPDYDFALSSAIYNRLGYGFAFPLDYMKMHKVDENLLELEESGVVDRIAQKWLGN